MYQMMKQYVPKYRWQLRHMGEHSEAKTAMVTQLAKETKERQAKEAKEGTNADDEDQASASKTDKVEAEAQSQDTDEDNEENTEDNGDEKDTPSSCVAEMSDASSSDEEARLRRIKLYSYEWEQEILANIWQTIGSNPKLFSVKEGNTPKQLLKCLIRDVEGLQTMPCLFETMCQNEDHILEIIKNMIDNILDRDLQRQTEEMRIREYEENQRLKREHEKEKRKAKALRHEKYAVGLSRGYRGGRGAKGGGFMGGKWIGGGAGGAVGAGGAGGHYHGPSIEGAYWD